MIATNPAQAETLIARMLPLPPEDQWAVVQAIAYSELPGWKTLLRSFADRLPARRLMIEKYLDGQLPTLDQAGFAGEPGAFAKLGGYLGFGDNRKKTLRWRRARRCSTCCGAILRDRGVQSGDLAHHRAHVVGEGPRRVDRLTLGGMAKYTLAANAAKDAKLLAMLKSVAKYYPKETKAELGEVIEAAETVDLAKLRKEALASIEELKRKGPGYKRDVSLWGQIGQGALALGCIGAAAAGQIEFGIPCVVGGAVSSAGLRYWETK